MNPTGQLNGLAVLVLLGCSGADEPAAPPIWSQLELTEQLRVGGIDDPAMTFGRIRDIAVFADGGIVVLDEQAPYLWFLDDQGQLLTRSGREGQGPGELAFPRMVGTQGDSVWVIDSGSGRVSWYSQAGSPLKSTLLPDAFHEPRPDGWVLFADGILSDGMTFGHYTIAINTAIERGITTLASVTVGADGQVADTLAPYPIAGLFFLMDIGFEQPSFGPNPYPETDLVRISQDQDEFVLVRRPAAPSRDPTSFAVRRVSFEGDTLMAVDLPYAPVPTDPARADRFAAETAMARAQRPGAPSEARIGEIARQAMDVPELRPPVTELVVGREGTIWIRREENGPLVRWMGLSREGFVLGVVEAPVEWELMAAGPSTWWTVELDSLDVPTLVRHRIGAGDAG